MSELDLLADTSESNNTSSSNTSLTVTLPSSDYRTEHAAKILKVQNGDTIRAGIVGQPKGDSFLNKSDNVSKAMRNLLHACDSNAEPNHNSHVLRGGETGWMDNEAIITWIPEGKHKKPQPTKHGKPPGSLRISFPNLSQTSDDTFGTSSSSSTGTSLILALPRPLQLGRILVMVGQLGVDHLILCGSNKVPSDYFGSHLFRRPEVLRQHLVEGLSLAGDVPTLPRVSVVKNVRYILEDGRLEEWFPKEEYARVIAHPLRRQEGGVAPLFMRDVCFPPSETGKGALARKMVVAIGPEGGWDDGEDWLQQVQAEEQEEPKRACKMHANELELFQQHGFQQVTLGTRVLRSDVAVVSLLTLARDAVRVANDPS